MGSKPAVLVTRPAGQSATLMDALRARGFSAFEQPLLEIQSLSGPQPQLDRTLAQLDKYQHIIFISGNAVRLGMARILAVWPQLPGDIPVYAIGYSTAEMLRGYALAPISAGEPMTSESLLAVEELQNVAGQRVLIVKGLGGRSTLAEALSLRGAEVEDFACYQRRCPVLEPGELAAKIARWEINLLLISSGEGLCNLLTLLGPAETIKLSAMPLIVPSMRVARMAEDAGFNTVYTADNASNTAMLEMVECSSLMAEKNK